MSFRILRLILWARILSIRAELAAVRKKSRLMLGVLGGFCLGYLGVGYYLFYSGLMFLHRFPLVGSLIAQRVLYLIFSFFFAMLVFSNAIIGYASLFRNRETNFLLSLPIRTRDVYLWKLLESLVLASWALLFLSAPMMVAWGRAGDAHGLFYFEVMAALLPFVIIPAMLGSWAILFLVRILSMRWAKRVLFAAGAACILWLAFGVKPAADVHPDQAVEILTFDSLLRNTRFSLSPFLPSSWMAQSVLAWNDGLFRKGGFFFLALLSNAMMGLLLSYEVAGLAFYGSWSASLSSRAERLQRRSLRVRTKGDRLPLLESLFRLLPFLSRPVRALTLKDARLFSRDPTQWTQFLIFFGVLCIYVLNLRNVALDYRSPYWEALISHPQSRRVHPHPLHADHPLCLSAVLAGRAPALDHRPLSHRDAEGAAAKIRVQLRRRDAGDRESHDGLKHDAAPRMGPRLVLRSGHRSSRGGALRARRRVGRAFPESQGGQPVEDRLRIRRHALPGHQLCLYRGLCWSHRRPGSATGHADELSHLRLHRASARRDVQRGASLRAAFSRHSPREKSGVLTSPVSHSAARGLRPVP